MRAQTAEAARFQRAMDASRRLMQSWLSRADPKTGLLPDRIGPGASKLATPHNFLADLYPYLILTASVTDPDLYRGRMLEMLRNEVLFMTATGPLPGSLDLATGRLGEGSLFGAGEYAKDGLLSVTELLGRTPWFYRMADMISGAMELAPVETRFGKLPAADSELNGDYLQALVRLATMTGDPRYLGWARRIGDAYIDEVLPGNHGLPSMTWDFAAHVGEPKLKLRDHGNEIVVGLTLLYALEADLASPRAGRYRPAVARMLDRILESANPDGMLYNTIDARTLQPLDKGLSDNWGYVYGAVYTFYQVTGETKYRDAVRHVLARLPKYKLHRWEPRNVPNDRFGSFDGYADSIESAIYLVNREPVPQALEWIESETRIMLAMQQPNGHVENWYGEGNFNRTLLLYAMMQSQGMLPAGKYPGLQLGAVRQGDQLKIHLSGSPQARVRFDFPRHRLVLNLARNYVRLNEFPEWYAVDPNRLYRIDGKLLRLGSELIEGIELAAGAHTVEPLGPPPYGHAGIK